MAEPAVTRPQDAPPVRIFQIPPTYSWVGSIVMLVLSLIAPVVVLVAGGNRSVLFSVIVTVTTVILALVGIVIYISLVSARLAVSAGGISYFSWGVSIRAAWDRVAGYGSLPPNRRKGLILYPEPENLPAEPRAVNVKLAKGDPKRFISLFPFDQRWQEGELGRLIRTYAPNALHDLGEVDLADFDRTHHAPTLPEPNPAPDETALATNPKFSRADVLIIGTDLILTAWALFLVYWL